MATDSPAAAAPAHTEVLEQFFAGHITAGQLTERLNHGHAYTEAPAVDAPTASLPAVAPAVRHRPSRRSLSLGALVAVAAAGGVVAGISIASSAQPVAAHVRASAPSRTPTHRHHARATKRHTVAAAPAATTPARSWTPAPAASAPATRPAARPARPKPKPEHAKPAKPHGRASKTKPSAPAPATPPPGVSSTPAPTSSTPTTTSPGVTPPPTGTTPGPTAGGGA